MPDGPRSLVVVAGTGTEVGKTWVGAQLATLARSAGLVVAARKPVQSFAPGTGPTDAEVLGAATGERPDDVCPPHRSYEVAMAPFMAAERLGRAPFTIEMLLDELRWPEDVDLGLVESAGGVRSPLTADGRDAVDLAVALAADRVVLVADAGLGTINAVRLCVDALAGQRSIVFLNRFDPADDLHDRNRTWIDAHVAAPVTVDVEGLLQLVTEK